MTDSKKFCQNCGFELEAGSEICKRCNLIAALNLENFLLSKYKILTVVGIFCALSVYLSTTAVSHDNNQYLQFGSIISLAIVILLSIICIWTLISYSLNILQFPFDDNIHYWMWFKLGFRFTTILLFTGFFVSIIGLITMYILLDNSIAETLFSFIIVAFFILVTITFIYYPYRHFIENRGNIFRFIVVFLLIFVTIFFIKQLQTDKMNSLLSMIFNVIFIIAIFVVAIRSIVLIYQTMNNGTRSLTYDNLRKNVGGIWKR